MFISDVYIVYIYMIFNTKLRINAIQIFVLRNSLKRVRWDAKLVPRKIELVKLDGDSAKQATIPGGRAARICPT